MTATPAVKTAANNYQHTAKLQTVHREHHKKYFTILGNETIRARIPGDPLTAKDVWLDALTCEETFIMTTKTLAKRHGVSKNVMGKLLTRLNKDGKSESVQFRDPVTKRFGDTRWVFYEKPKKPEPPKRGCGSTDENKHKHCENKPESRDPQNGDAALYIDQDIKKKQHIEKTTSPPLNPPPKSTTDQPPEKNKDPNNVVDLKNIRKLINREISFRIKDIDLISKCKNISDIHISWASQVAMEKGRKNKAGYFMKLLEVEMVEQNEHKLKYANLPTDVDGHSDEMKKITCYNRNVTNTTCTAIKGLTKPSNECIAYCPYYTKQGLVQ